MPRFAVLIAVALIAVPAAVLAQGSRQDRASCTGDVWRLCASEIPDVDAIVACLKRNRRVLSPGCQQVFADDPRGRPSQSTRADESERQIFCSAGAQDEWSSWCRGVKTP